MHDLLDDSDDEISFSDIFITIKEHVNILILGPLSAGVAALGASFLIAPVFTATTTFLPPQQQQGGAAAMLQGLGSLGGLAGAATGLKNPIDQYVAFVKSRSVADALVRRFDLLKRYEATFEEDAVKTLASNTRISSGKDGLIKIEVEDISSEFAAKLANAHVEELNNLLDRLAVTDAQRRRAFYERQLAKTQVKLNVAQSALQGSGINEGALRAEPKAAAEAYAALKAQVTAVEVGLQSMRAHMTEQSPELKALHANLNALRGQLAKVESTNHEAADDDYIAKYRDFKYQEMLFEMFAKQFELAKLDEAKEGATIQVVDVARPPERRSRPRRLLIVVSTMAAVGTVLLIAVFVRKSLRKAEKDVETA